MKQENDDLKVNFERLNNQIKDLQSDKEQTQVKIENYEQQLQSTNLENYQKLVEQTIMNQNLKDKFSEETVAFTNTISMQGMEMDKLSKQVKQSQAIIVQKDKVLNEKTLEIESQ